MQKQALITGATSGIGRATALRLAKEGYAVIATGRRADRLATLRAEIEAAGGRCTTLAFDVRSEEEVRRNLSPLENIDLLVNNAGLAAGLEHIDLGDTRDWDAMIDTNVKGLLYVTRVIAPKMVAAGRGHIFNIGSIAGTEAYENGAVYCASKHAVHAISQSMRADLLSAGIKVTEIRPGMVETEFSEVRFHGDKKRADAVYDGVEPLTGAEVAEKMLRDNNIHNVKVTHVGGHLTDHFNPQTMTVNLSDSVYSSSSVAAAAVAAHECGHAVQHARGYAPLTLRSQLVPVVQFASTAATWVIILGLVILASTQNELLCWIGVGMIAMSALFSLVTLPVEYNASARAVEWLQTSRTMQGAQLAQAKEALSWAARTYLVAALSAIASVLYYVFLILGRRD